MTTIELIQTLQSLDRGYFTVADMEKIIGLSKDSLKVALSRLTTKKVLTRVKRGVYQLSLSEIDAKKIANQLYYPSYLSFESALSIYGILSQIPITQTFATVKKSKKMTLGNTEVEFTQIKKDLFFGYVLDKGIYIAEPEKALLDELYMVSRGLRNINIEELDLKEIKEEKIREYAKKFPPYIMSLVDKVKKYIGTTPVTNEAKERIVTSFPCPNCERRSTRSWTTKKEGRGYFCNKCGSSYGSYESAKELLDELEKNKKNQASESQQT